MFYRTLSRLLCYFGYCMAFSCAPFLDFASMDEDHKSQMIYSLFTFNFIFLIFYLMKVNSLHANVLT